MKVHGFIVVDDKGKPLCGPYGHVLLFKNAETAKREGPAGGDVKPVIIAKVPRKKKEKCNG